MRLHLFNTACPKLSISNLPWKMSVVCYGCQCMYLMCLIHTAKINWPLGPIKFKLELQLVLYSSVCFWVFNSNLVQCLCDLNRSVRFTLFPSGGDGGSGGIMEWVFAPFQQSLHMASCLLCLFIASFWETLHSPRMQHKPKHLSVPSPEPVIQGILLFLPYFSAHTFSHLSSPPHLQSFSPQPGLVTDFFVFGA